MLSYRLSFVLIPKEYAYGIQKVSAQKGFPS